MSAAAIVRQITADFDITDLAHNNWREANQLLVDQYWSGEPAPISRHFSAKLLWTDTALYIKFEAGQSEPLIVSDDPLLTAKTIGLWERDVCEIFISPDLVNVNKYYEFEVAPTGEWLDLALETTHEGRLADWEYNSTMETAAEISEGRIVMALKIPFTSIGGTPQKGDMWRANLFRCVGCGTDRGYLAWRPTLTDKPNFHVPSRFGPLVFE